MSNKPVAYRGMLVVVAKISKEDLARRKRCLAQQKRRMVEFATRPGSLGQKGGKVIHAKKGVEPDVVIDIAKMDDVHCKVQAGSKESTFKGKSDRRCPRCNRVLNMYAGLYGKRHYLCPKCGWSSRRKGRPGWSL